MQLGNKYYLGTLWLLIIFACCILHNAAPGNAPSTVVQPMHLASSNLQKDMIKVEPAHRYSNAVVSQKRDHAQVYMPTQR